MRGLFVNSEKNQCSIYESGLMIYNALRTKHKDIEYMEVSPRNMNERIYSGFDYYIFNWHHNTLPISKETLDNIHTLKIGILLEVGPTEIKPFMQEDLFDAYMVLDPTKKQSGKYYPFPRPLEVVDNLLPLLYEDVPVIGTFGFFVQGKNFAEVLQAANDLGQDCVLRMNLPDARFTGVSFQTVKDFANRLQRFKSSNVDLRITHDYMSKPDLIKWCSQNTLNVFPYHRNLPGLSAVTDQAIVAGRGIAITDCDTFRHMNKYISYYPKETYLQLSKSTLPGIKQMQEDWSNDKFVAQFDKLLFEQMVGE